LIYERQFWKLKSATADAKKRFGVEKLYRVPNENEDEWGFTCFKPGTEHFTNVRDEAVGDDHDITAVYGIKK